MKNVKKYESGGMSQGRIISLGFFLIIMAGTLLLMCPFASRDGQWTNFFDALFTATSSTCVTGLVVADTFTKWSITGQIIILILIQIGGLGFITIGVVFSMFFRRNIGLKVRGLMQESVSALKIGGIIKLAKTIFIGAVIFEGSGAIILSLRFIPDMGVLKGIYYGIFHSVSAFCNAGFDLMGYQEQYCSLVNYYDDVVINMVIMALIIIGGIGFMVWADIKQNKWHIRKYCLHTKLVLMTTFFLLTIPSVLFFVIEYNGVLSGMSFKGKVLSAMFASVTARTAGFNTIDTGAMTGAGKLLTIFLMFIGGSPGSTAGGIKTVTFIVEIMAIRSLLLHKKGCEIHGRRIEEASIKKASIIFDINLLLAVGAAFLIMNFQTLPFEDVLFEVFSAIGTVGMTTGITRSLTLASRLVIILLMYCGRVGSMTFALTFTANRKNSVIELPVEKVTVG